MSDRKIKLTDVNGNRLKVRVESLDDGIIAIPLIDTVIDDSCELSVDDLFELVSQSGEAFANMAYIKVDRSALNVKRLAQYYNFKAFNYSRIYLVVMKLTDADDIDFCITPVDTDQTICGYVFKGNIAPNKAVLDLFDSQYLKVAKSIEGLEVLDLRIGM